MADEITISATLRAINAGVTVVQRVSDRFDQSNLGASQAIQTVATTAEALSINSDISTVGWAWLTNVDATNFVEVGHWDGTTFFPVLRLKPKEVAVARLSPSATLYARADTADVQLQVIVLED